MLVPLVVLAAAALPFPETALDAAFAGRKGTLVLLDVDSRKAQRRDTKIAAEKFAPCSTFKIWNTAIGLETGLLTSADQPFWKWDGVKRGIEPWNHDLTLREAYAVSCVPAYQGLARRIGAERMDEWIKKIGYGNRNTSSGLDVFWLPAPGRQPLLISPDAQAELMLRLARGDVPFSKQVQVVLKDIMKAKSTGKGTLYGKTGTSGEDTDPVVGWYVGYVESGGKTFAFACLLLGPGAAGKEARALVEQVFTSQGLL